MTVNVVGDCTFIWSVSPGCTLAFVVKPSMSPQESSLYQSPIGVPGLEFSHTMGLEPAPQGSPAAMAAVGTRIVAAAIIIESAPGASRYVIL